MNKSVIVKSDSSAQFFNNVDFCVGTGRMGLALTKEYMEQLKLVQDEIGFKHIRGHGIFSDDMAIYQSHEENGKTIVEYNFTYLDFVMDNYLSVNITPFLELGFMPSKMASGDQTIFYWKGNVTPPSSYDSWCELVEATLRHLMERYGADEVVTWPIEVWNEPNLPGFWKNADMDEYLVLFEKTFNCIKAIDKRFKVGGPAICGVEDKKHMKFFMDFINDRKFPIDFITRHHYTSDDPQRGGHYGYIDLREINYSFQTLNDSREIIDSYPDYKGLPMHITEFNTAYIPNAPIHDTNQNASYVADMLSRFGETSESYSYWTFGDIFEEWGVPFAPFHGGFGMVANRGIRKPTFYAFKFFKQLSGKCLLKEDKVIVCKKDNGFNGLLYASNNVRKGENLSVSFSIEADYKEYSLIQHIVDEETCNPLKVWHDLGEPSSLTKAQENLLRECDKPLIKTNVMTVENGKLNFSLDVKEFGLVYFELIPHVLSSDRGYDYNRVIK